MQDDAIMQEDRLAANEWASAHALGRRSRPHPLFLFVNLKRTAAVKPDGILVVAHWNPMLHTCRPHAH